jgi:hypothetical protein
VEVARTREKRVTPLKKGVAGLGGAPPEISSPRASPAVWETYSAAPTINLAYSVGEVAAPQRDRYEGVSHLRLLRSVTVA